jgi:DNA polymerase-3 subunit gamma/tau
MLTNEAFNALLKTLEEPPDHVFFMFATTELHKIPITILSRCQRYELKRVSAEDLKSHFGRLSEEEGVQIEGAALNLIVRESEGSVRDGLSLLDQVFSYGEKEISVEDVVQVLGLVSRDIILGITRALLEKAPGAALLALDETFNFGVDLKRFTTDLLNAFRTLILCKIDGCQELIDIPKQELEEFKTLAGQYEHDTIHMRMNLLMQGVEEMRYSPQPRLSLESTFLKIIQADDVVPVASILAKLDTLLAGQPLAKSQAVPAQAHSEQKKTPETLTDQEDLRAPEQTPSPHLKAKSVVAKPESTPPIQAEEPPLPEENQAPPVDKSNKPVPHPHKRDVRRDWQAFIEHVKDRKLWMAQDLQRTDTVKEIDGELRLRFSDQANCALLCQKDNVKLLTEFILDFFQKDLKLRFITPVKLERDDSDNAESPHKLRNKLANDPLVLMATEIFNGQIGDIRVGPRSR